MSEKQWLELDVKCETCGTTHRVRVDPTLWGFGRIREGYRTTDQERKRRSDRLKALRASGKAGRRVKA